MDVLVCVVWSVALLTHTPCLKAESVPAFVPALTTESLNEATDPFVTSKITGPKEPIRTNLSGPPPPSQHLRSNSTDRDRAQDELKDIQQPFENFFSSGPDTPPPKGSPTASLPTMTPMVTINYLNTNITDPKKLSRDTTVLKDIIQMPKSTTPTSVAQGSSNVTSPLISPRSTTITSGLSIPSSMNHSEGHQNSKQSSSSETIPTVSLNPPSFSASARPDLIMGSASLMKEDQDESSELDVGDEDLDIVTPSPLDPLLAGLISIFIASTALLSVILFLKFRQQSSHPEFHRLQDLPMDDLLEDTPLSRHLY